MNAAKQRTFEPSINIPFMVNMNITELFNQHYVSKSAKVLVTKIGLKGLKFKSFLRLPKNENIVWNFQIKLGYFFVNVEGTIIECEFGSSEHEYEVVWRINSKNTYELIKFLSFHTYGLPSRNDALKIYSLFSESHLFKRNIDFRC